MNKIYAGIGSRETPENILHLMQNIGLRAAKQGWTLRSGGAQGADLAFEIGCTAGNGKKEIYLPWSGFNGRYPNEEGVYANVWLEALDMAAQFHPNWAACSQGARALHARNCYQVLGEDLKTPANKIICWTPHAKRGGGTGQALRIAEHHHIEIHDLADPKIEELYRTALGCVS